MRSQPTLRTTNRYHSFNAGVSNEIGMNRHVPHRLMCLNKPLKLSQPQLSVLLFRVAMVMVSLYSNETLRDVPTQALHKDNTNRHANVERVSTLRTRQLRNTGSRRNSLSREEAPAGYPNGQL